MKPEDRLAEAQKQITLVSRSDDLPNDVSKELASAINTVAKAESTISQWREFVDDDQADE